MSTNLREVIIAACTPGQSQATANAWISEFSATHDAWSSAQALLEDPQEQISFFAANILLSKTRKEWPFLKSEDQDQCCVSVK